MTKYEFSTRRTECPECGSSDGVALLRDDPQVGYCHSHGDWVSHNRQGIHRTNSQIKKSPKGTGRSYSKNNSKLLKKIRSRDVYDSSFYHRWQPNIADDLYGEAERSGIMMDSFMMRESADMISGLRDVIDDEIAENDDVVTNMDALLRISPAAHMLVKYTRSTVFDDWQIGMTGYNGLKFWYRDFTGNYSNCKSIDFYSGRFNRDKSTPPKMIAGCKQCLYGEHQLNPYFVRWDGEQFQQNAHVMLVESEKSVVIASYYLKDFIWVASGGTTGLTKTKASVLKNRIVNVMFDADDAGQKNTNRTMKILREIGAFPQLITLDQIYEDCPKGMDIADVIINTIEGDI